MNVKMIESRLEHITSAHGVAEYFSNMIMPLIEVSVSERDKALVRYLVQQRMYDLHKDYVKVQYVH